MERIVAINDVYAFRENNCVSMTLTNNYRSDLLLFIRRCHKAILKFPSLQFYGDKLAAKADPKIVDVFLRWKILKNPNFPLLFHGIEGEDLRESDSPSFFNRIEASALVELISSNSFRFTKRSSE